MADSYITVSNESVAEYSEKKSRFIARVIHVDSEEEAAAAVADAKSRFWDARHNVYAYILRNGSARFSDDGEPHGTAGKPVYDQLKGSGIVDAAVIVTRYFGGILLGTGGLVHAYSTAAGDALKNADVCLMCPCDICDVFCDYRDHARLISLIESFGGDIISTDFTDRIRVSFALKQEKSDEFEISLCETFSSKLSLKRIKTEFFAKRIKK